MIVYTVIYNDYDTLKEPRFVDPNVKYVVFSNTPQESDVWQWIRTPMTQVKDQRKLKILGYQNLADNYTMYIDASIEIKGSVFVFAAQWEYDLTLLQHRGRDCIYQEANAVVSWKKDEPKIVYEQIGKYAKEKFPHHAGLIQTGLIIRRRNKELDDFMDAWWAEVEKHSKRDQLSFNYVAWKRKKEYDIIPMNVFSNGFVLHGHRVQRFSNGIRTV